MHACTPRALPDDDPTLCLEWLDEGAYSAYCLRGGQSQRRRMACMIGCARCTIHLRAHLPTRLGGGRCTHTHAWLGHGIPSACDGFGHPLGGRAPANTHMHACTPRALPDDDPTLCLEWLDEGAYSAYCLRGRATTCNASDLARSCAPLPHMPPPPHAPPRSSPLPAPRSTHHPPKRPPAHLTQGSGGPCRGNRAAGAR
jgi:hypothetical protein